MSRFASGAILGFFLGALVVMALAGQSDDGSATHFRLPLKFELEFGEAADSTAEATTNLDSGSDRVAPVKVPEQFQSLVEMRREIGSALAGTMLDVNCPEDSEAEIVAALPAIAAEENSVAPVETQTTTQFAPASPLEQAASEIYRQADACELSCDFERADRFRRLARQIRAEIAGTSAGNPEADAPRATTADARSADDGYPLD
jgi:hypothetical protein